MKIRFSCLPGHEAFLPKPTLASGHLPDWLKRMPASAESTVLAGAEVRTVKQCPPFVDAMQTGILFPLATDVRVEGGEFSWDWDLPRHPESRLTRSPVGIHVPEQATGAPGVPDGQFVLKFTNFWAVALPEGWSMLFGHPVNRIDLPFQTLTGLVDCDSFADGFVHFPALWTDPDFEGVLPAGTPVAQGFPVRREALDLEIGEFDDDGVARHRAVEDGLQAERGAYRKGFRAGRP